MPTGRTHCLEAQFFLGIVVTWQHRSFPPRELEEISFLLFNNVRRNPALNIPIIKDDYFWTSNNKII
jgi:hypothetical protein